VDLTKILTCFRLVFSIVQNRFAGVFSTRFVFACFRLSLLVVALVLVCWLGDFQGGGSGCNLMCVCVVGWAVVSRGTSMCWDGIRMCDESGLGSDLFGFLRTPSVFPACFGMRLGW
jgi:hypothetical protein